LDPSVIFVKQFFVPARQHMIIAGITAWTIYLTFLRMQMLPLQTQRAFCTWQLRAACVW
jgi:hypothetical protein